jgi:hypothetical protein
MTQGIQLLQSLSSFQPQLARMREQNFVAIEVSSVEDETIKMVWCLESEC